MEDKTGGPAFPEVAYKAPEAGSAHMMTISGGMTLRDYFAAKAMQGLLVSFPGDSMQRDVINASYKLADAMLEARK